MRYNKTSLQKIETLFGEIGYTVRYEKGNFNSGYCIVEQRKMAIVNKFFDIEARINTLVDILSYMAVPTETLTEDSQKMWKQVTALWRVTEAQVSNEALQAAEETSL